MHIPCSPFRILCLATTLLGILISASALPGVAQVPSLGINASLHGKRLFPTTNSWNEDISNKPVDPHSQTYIASMGARTPLHPDFGTTWQGAPNGFDYMVVAGNQKRVPIAFTIADESDPGPYPIPTNAPIEGGPNSNGDRHVLIVDRDAWELYEIDSSFPVVQSGLVTSWKGYSGAKFNLTTGAERPICWTSADAAGLPIFPGLVRYDEVFEQKAINHALRFTVDHTRHAFVDPARHYASSSTSASLPPMGMRMRLKASFNITGFPPEVQVILKALKKYGMFLADNGSNLYLSGQHDQRWSDDRLSTMSHVHASDFEVVQMGAVTTNCP